MNDEYHFTSSVRWLLQVSQEFPPKIFDVYLFIYLFQIFCSHFNKSLIQNKIRERTENLAKLANCLKLNTASKNSWIFVFVVCVDTPICNNVVIQK